VVKQQNPYGLSPYSGNQFPFDRLLGHQTHGPTCVARWRIAAYHGNDALLLVAIQHFGRSGTWSLIESALQTGLLVTMPEPPDRLRRQRDHFGDLGRNGSFGQLQ